MNGCWEEFLLQSSLWLGCHRLCVMLRGLTSREADEAAEQLEFTSRVLSLNAAPFSVFIPSRKTFLARQFHARLVERDARRRDRNKTESIAATVAHVLPEMIEPEAKLNISGTADAIRGFLSGVGAARFPFQLRTSTQGTLAAVRALLRFEQFERAAAALPRSAFGGLLDRAEIANADNKTRQLAEISKHLEQQLQLRASHTPSPADSLAHLGGTSQGDRRLLARAEQIIRELSQALKEHQRRGIEARDVMADFDHQLGSLQKILAGPGVRWRAMVLKDFLFRAAPFLDARPAELLDEVERQAGRVEEADVDPAENGAVALLREVAAWLDGRGAAAPHTVWEQYRSMAGQFVPSWEVARIEDGSLTAEELIEERGCLPASTLRTGLRMGGDGQWLVVPRARRPVPFCELLEQAAEWLLAHQGSPRTATECRRLAAEVARRRDFGDWVAALNAAHRAAPHRSPLWTVRNIVLAIQTCARTPAAEESGRELAARFGQFGFCFVASAHEVDKVDDDEIHLDDSGSSELIDIGPGVDAAEAASNSAPAGVVPAALDFLGPAEAAEAPLRLPPVATLPVGPVELEGRPVLRTLHHLAAILRRIQGRRDEQTEELVACLLDILCDRDGASDVESARAIIAWCSRRCALQDEHPHLRLYRRLGSRLAQCLERELEHRVYPPLDDRLRPVLTAAPSSSQADVRFRVGEPQGVSLLQLGGPGEPARLELTADAAAIRWLELPEAQSAPPLAVEFQDHCRRQFWIGSESPSVDTFRIHFCQWLQTAAGEQWLNGPLPQALDELLAADARQPLSPLAQWARQLLMEECLPAIPRIDLERRRLWISPDDIDFHCDWPAEMVATHADSPVGEVQTGRSLTADVADRRLRFAASFHRAAAQFCASPASDDSPLPAAQLLFQLRDRLPEAMRPGLGSLLGLTVRQLLLGKPPLTVDLDRKDRDRLLDLALSLANLCLDTQRGDLPSDTILQAVRQWLRACQGLVLIPAAWQLGEPLLHAEVAEYEPAAEVYDAARSEGECVLRSFGLRSPKKVRHQPDFTIVVGKPPEGYQELLELLHNGGAPLRPLAENLASWPVECRGGKSEFRLAQDFFVEFYKTLDRDFRSSHVEEFKSLEGAVRRMMERHFRLKYFRPQSALDYPPHWLEVDGTPTSQPLVEYVHRPGLSTQNGDLCVQAMVSLGTK